MAGILRGEARWADLRPARRIEQAGGNRPVLVLSQDIFNERSGAIVALAITTQPQRAGFPLTLELQSVQMPRSEEIAQVIEGLDEIIGA